MPQRHRGSGPSNTIGVVGGGQVAVGREAIAYHNPAKGAPKQLDGGGHRKTQVLEPSPTNGLRQASFVMTWLPTAVHADQLQGPLGRLAAGELKEIAAAVIQSLDLHCQEPWQPNGEQR